MWLFKKIERCYPRAMMPILFVLAVTSPGLAAPKKHLPCKPVGTQCVGIILQGDEYWTANRVVRDPVLSLT